MVCSYSEEGSFETPWSVSTLAEPLNLKALLDAFPSYHPFGMRFSIRCMAQENVFLKSIFTFF